MKRFIILCLVLVIGFSLYANGNKEKVLLFIRHGRSDDIDYMIQQEVFVMASMLEESGFKVILATDTGEPIRDRLEKSTLLKPDIRLADIKVEDYVGIIMPCMAKGPAEKSDPEEMSLVKEAVALGVPIAAQHCAADILVAAGVMEDKKYTRTYGEVIQDGKIITSRYCPFLARAGIDDDQTPELTRLFIETIKD